MTDPARADPPRPAPTLNVVAQNHDAGRGTSTNDAARPAAAVNCQQSRIVGVDVSNIAREEIATISDSIPQEPNANFLFRRLISWGEHCFLLFGDVSVYSERVR